MPDSEEHLPTLALEAAERPRPSVDLPLRLPERYQRRGEIGRGGMGTVEAWLDPHIGREVATKILLDPAGPHRERFLYEARVQGALAHRAIVPVYDLAFLADGRPFFTMQRVHGVTLGAILAAPADSPIRTRFSTRKMLEALARIALAVDFAHQRDVVHRDLKPANLMLGEFGEVYVLDWGIAKRGASAADEAPSPAADLPEGGMTAHGTLLGTPGYMSPEQARGAPIDARSDVYALGCVLFEILTRTPLHQGSRVTDLILSTLSETVERSPSKRAPSENVAPELDALCLAATEPDRDRRLASARLFAEGIERFLEGDRDEAARAEAAERHAERAAILAGLALEDGEAPDTLRALHASGETLISEALDPEEARAHALYEIGRAIAYAPQHEGAMRTLVRLLTEPPRALPAEVQRELDDRLATHVRIGGRTGAIAYGIASAIFSALLVGGVIDGARGGWLPAALFGGAALLSYAFSRMESPGMHHSVIMLIVSTLAIASLSTIFSPFIALPTVVCVNTMLFVISNDRSIRPFVIPIGAAGVLLPIGAELVGLTPPSYRLQDGAIVLLPRFMQFTQISVVVLVISFVVTTVIASLTLAPFRDDLDDAQRRSRLLAWQLRQLHSPSRRKHDRA